MKCRISFVVPFVPSPSLNSPLSFVSLRQTPDGLLSFFADADFLHSPLPFCLSVYTFIRSFVHSSIHRFVLPPNGIYFFGLSSFMCFISLLSSHFAPPTLITDNNRCTISSFISFHLIPSHPIPSHLVSSRRVSSLNIDDHIHHSILKSTHFSSLL